MHWIRRGMVGVAFMALLAGAGSAATTGLVVGQNGNSARQVFDVEDIRLQCSEWDLDWLSLGPAGYGSAGSDFTVGPDGAIYAAVWAGDTDGDAAYIGIIKAVEDEDGAVTIKTLHQETFEWDVTRSDSETIFKAVVYAGFSNGLVQPDAGDAPDLLLLKDLDPAGDSLVGVYALSTDPDDAATEGLRLVYQAPVSDKISTNLLWAGDADGTLYLLHFGMHRLDYDASSGEYEATTFLSPGIPSPYSCTTTPSTRAATSTATCGRPTTRRRTRPSGPGRRSTRSTPRGSTTTRNTRSRPTR